jgi:hypothetical protein
MLCILPAVLLSSGPNGTLESGECRAPPLGTKRTRQGTPDQEPILGLLSNRIESNFYKFDSPISNRTF